MRSQMVAVFDDKSKHVHFVNLANKTMTKFVVYPEDIWYFSAVSHDRYIYVLKWADYKNQRPVYRVQYNDVTAMWERMRDWPKLFGWIPPIVASSNAMYLIGGGRILSTLSKSISKYDRSTDQWERLADKPTGTYTSLRLGGDQFIYCIGGRDKDDNPTGKVERMDLKTMEWTRIADMNQQGGIRSAAEWRGKIYVFHGQNEQLSVESWDPKANQWTATEPIIPFKCTGLTKTALVIDDKLYLVSKSKIV